MLQSGFKNCRHALSSRWKAHIRRNKKPRDWVSGDWFYVQYQRRLEAKPFTEYWWRRWGEDVKYVPRRWRHTLEHAHWRAESAVHRARHGWSVLDICNGFYLPRVIAEMAEWLRDNRHLMVDARDAQGNYIVTTDNPPGEHMYLSETEAYQVFDDIRSGLQAYVDWHTGGSEVAFDAAIQHFVDTQAGVVTREREDVAWEHYLAQNEAVNARARHAIQLFARYFEAFYD